MENRIQTVIDALKWNTKVLNDIEGSWDGDMPGIAEENAANASEANEMINEAITILEKCKKLVTDF